MNMEERFRQGQRVLITDEGKRMYPQSVRDFFNGSLFTGIVVEPCMGDYVGVEVRTSETAYFSLLKWDGSECVPIETQFNPKEWL